MLFVVICHRKIVLSKIRWEKVENFTLNPYILEQFTYNRWNSRKIRKQDTKSYPIKYNIIHFGHQKCF